MANPEYRKWCVVRICIGVCLRRHSTCCTHRSQMRPWWGRNRRFRGSRSAWKRTDVVSRTQLHARPQLPAWCGFLNVSPTLCFTLCVFPSPWGRLTVFLHAANSPSVAPQFIFAACSPRHFLRRCKWQALTVDGRSYCCLIKDEIKMVS